MGKISQQIGKNGEKIAAALIKSLGIRCDEKIGTPVRLMAHPSMRGFFRVIFGEPVAADRHGLLSNGRGVLIETKTIFNANLTWSDFEDHQPGKLTDWAASNGLALVVWVHESGEYVMEWPIDGFRKGHGVTPEKAKELDTKTRAMLNFI